MTDQVAQKIKALAEMTKSNGTEITELISTRIDDILSEEIVQAMNEKLASLGIENMSLSVSHQPNEEFVYIPNGQSRPFLEPQGEDVFLGDVGLADHTEEGDVVIQDTSAEREEAIDEEDFSMADGLAEEGLEEDTPLPDNNIMFPGDMEEDVAIKNKENEEVEYEDDIMADAQAMAEGDDYEGGYEEPVGDMGSGRRANVSNVGNDAPTDDSGMGGDDLLPVDLDIDSVLDSKGSVDFFAAAMQGQRGDKTKRDGIKQKRVRSTGY